MIVCWKWTEVGRGGSAFGEKYGFCFVNVNTQFPFSEISKKNRRSLVESFGCCVCAPGLSKNCSVIDV
jgi:hypothetical protein